MSEKHDMHKAHKLQIVGLTNSCRANSYNQMVLNHIKSEFHDLIDLHLFDISSIPFYEDRAEAATFSSEISALSTLIEHSHGLVVASPEYNHSVPARLKNTIDWMSRMASKPLLRLPVMLISASTGHLGGVRVQYELRRIFEATDSRVMIKPEVFIGKVHEKFASSGVCTDRETRDMIKNQFHSFFDWMKVYSLNLSCLEENIAHP
jgi:chromate reductase